MIVLPLPRPFSVGRTLAFLHTSSLRTPYHFDHARRLRRLVRFGGRASVVEFAFDEPEARLRARVLGSAAGDGRAAALRRLATHVWRLDDDLARGYRVLRGDPLMAPLVGRCAGLRNVRTPGLYEALLTAVLGQQISVAAAESLRRRLMEALGDRRTSGGVAYLGYPAPRRLRAASPGALQALGLSRQKARYVREIADRAVADRLDAAAFDGLSDERAVEQLREIPGVGRWTAEIALMRGLGRRDIFPAGDLGLALAVQRLQRRATRPEEPELRSLAERWAGWRSYAALYLWWSLGINA